MTDLAISWHLFIVSIPTSGATLRMRVWRTLKGLGCAALRDGAYLVPSTVGQAELTQLLSEITQEGGNGWLLEVAPLVPSDDTQYKTLFDRTEEYTEWLASLATARRTLSELPVQELKKTARKLRRDYDAIVAIDFFPNDASAKAATAWKDFDRAVDLLLGSNEPSAITGEVRRLPAAEYRNRRWATRQRLWVDRVASAWLIARYIDPNPTFLWLPSPADCPPDALGFDFDGAAFTHVGNWVTFQVLLASFGLDKDPALVRMGALVNALDLGTTFVPEAAGFEAILSGARHRHSGDDELLAAIGSVLDALYLSFYNHTPAST